MSRRQRLNPVDDVTGVGVEDSDSVIMPARLVDVGGIADNSKVRRGCRWHPNVAESNVDVAVGIDRKDLVLVNDDLCRGRGSGNSGAQIGRGAARSRSAEWSEDSGNGCHSL